LSVQITRKRSSDSWSIWISTSAGMRASSAASSELSTSSLTVVSRAFAGLSKPSRWRFLAKNSETEISRCLRARRSPESICGAAGSADGRSTAAALRPGPLGAAFLAALALGVGLLRGAASFLA